MDSKLTVRRAKFYSNFEGIDSFHKANKAFGSVKIAILAVSQSGIYRSSPLVVTDGKFNI